ncbi:hypothetical protein ACFL4D_01235, partial [Candidatus Margulisiibacteriota bacterium]
TDINLWTIAILSIFHVIRVKEKGRYIESGGVERFKKEIHGKGLNYSAVIGYVQEQDFKYWEQQINSWIDQLLAGQIPSAATWEEKDRLVHEDVNTDIARYKSENAREQNSITLFHLWVNMVKNDN